jgi:hypothetical protein
MARLLDRSKKSGRLGGSPSVTAASFDSAGVNEGEGLTAAQVAAILREYPSVNEVGHPGVNVAEATAGNATVTETVPSGKYWRLIGVYHTLVTDANVANRAVVFKTRNAADTNILTITHANVAASTTAKRTTLFGQDDYVVGDEAVAAQGTLTIAEPVTANDTFTINGVLFTLVAALTQGTENQILIGASEAATKLALDAAFADRDNGGVLHSVSDATYEALGVTAVGFAGDDMVFTANVKGTAGDALEFVEGTLTHASNVLDGSGTLGGTTAGVDAADKVTSDDFPVSGILLDPGFDVNISVTNGVAGDALDTYLFYIEYDADPTP